MTPDPKKLRAAREAANLTQQGAADLLSCSRRTVNRWEQSTAKPNARDLRVMADLYGCPMIELCEVSSENA